VSSQGALVIEAAYRGLRDRASPCQHAAGGVKAHPGEVGVRGQSGGAPEEGDQLEGREPDSMAELAQRDALDVTRVDLGEAPMQRPRIARWLGDPAASATMALEEPPQLRPAAALGLAARPDLSRGHDEEPPDRRSDRDP